MGFNMGIYNASTSLKGQVTVPAEVRKIMGLEPGGRLQFRTGEDGTVTVVAKRRGARGLKGIFGQPDAPIDVEAEIMKEVWQRNRPGASGSRS